MTRAPRFFVIEEHSLDGELVFKEPDWDWDAVAEWIGRSVEFSAARTYCNYPPDARDAAVTRFVEEATRYVREHVRPQFRIFARDVLLMLQRKLYGEALIHAFQVTEGDRAAVQRLKREHAKGQRELFMRDANKWFGVHAGRNRERTDSDAARLRADLEQRIAQKQSEMRDAREPHAVTDVLEVIASEVGASKGTLDQIYYPRKQAPRSKSAKKPAPRSKSAKRRVRT